jgi:putative hydrolase of the HAD superfamily
VKPKTTGIGCLLLDVGGVLLSDGWSHGARQAAAARFKLNLEEMEARHRQTYDTYELGKLTLAEYLDQTVSRNNRTHPPAQAQISAQDHRGQQRRA